MKKKKKYASTKVKTSQEIIPEKKVQGYLMYLFGLAWTQKKSMIVLLSLTVLGVCARLAEPYLYKVVVDTLSNGLIAGVFASAQMQTLIWVIVIWFFLSILQNVTSSQASYLVWKVGTTISQKVHIAGYRRLLRMDYSTHMSQHSSRFAKIVDDADVSTWEMTNWWLRRFTSAILGFIGMLIIALSVSWQMTLIAIAIIPPGLWFILRNVRKYRAEQRRVNKMWEEKHEHLSDQVSNIVTYKLNPFEDIFLKRHEVYSARAANAQIALDKKWRLVEMLNPDAFARFLVLGVGIFFVKDGSITLGTLFMFMGLLNEILTPLHVLGDILPQYSRRAQQIQRLLILFEKEDSIKNAENPVPFSKISGEIGFHNVSYSYPKEKSSFALQNISFAIKPNQTLALVGYSGSGKSTIMSLLVRLVDPTKGRITIDGIDLREFQPEKLKRYIGTVLQENSMYNETVGANIAYGDPHASKKRIIEAAQQAGAHEFISKLPKGYETMIGERGVRLSGGEKQRIAIARAILKNPKIVVLDEPTSALDSITEKKVQEGINALVQGRTTIIIAHRISTVHDADMTIVLKDGKVIGQGHHTELIRTCPTYKTMVSLQSEGFLPDNPER
ncbi:MAG: ABC transporter ATP-binding protein [bacterium]|nr:ABC transporter ATP-binding protein [bacterium]